MNNKDLCIICKEKYNLMNYEHDCGNYNIHKNCLIEWYKIEGNVCFLCRKINENIDKYKNSNVETINNCCNIQ
jgi:hypothetical protein